MNVNSSTSTPGEEDPTRQALILWADPRVGIGSTARAIARQLQEPAHGYQILELDLSGSLIPGPWIQAVASMMGQRLETSMLASLGWQEVKERVLPGQPHVVVAMDPASAAVVDSWRAKGLLQAPLVGVVSGLSLDPAWARTAVDRLSVVDPAQAEAGLKMGLPMDSLVPCGLYVCSGFSAVRGGDRAELRRKFSLAAERPVVLVVTEGMAHDELSSALFQLSLVADRATVLFDVARDDDSAELLRRRAGLYNFQAQMFGKVEDAGQLWAASDLVLAKPHLYVEQRAVALGLPYLFLLPGGGAEQATARVYAERGLGRSVTHVSTLAADVELLLVPEALSASRQGHGGDLPAQGGGGDRAAGGPGRGEPRADHGRGAGATGGAAAGCPGQKGPACGDAGPPGGHRRISRGTTAGTPGGGRVADRPAGGRG